MVKSKWIKKAVFTGGAFIALMNALTIQFNLTEVTVAQQMLLCALLLGGAVFAE